MVRLLVAVLALAVIAFATERLIAAGEGVLREDVTIGGTPATVYRPVDALLGTPVVVVAHGFAGSKTLMDPFATALARNGYLALAFDFLGHGEHPEPLAGDVTEVDGATRALVAQTEEAIRFAEALEGAGEGLALLGHSMAADIIVRTAIEQEAVDAVVAVSMFSPVVTASAPDNLLIIVGAWEVGLTAEALRVVGLATDGAAEEGTTYGDFADGTARRAAFSGGSEHIAVLYDEESLAEAVRWLDGAFGIDRTAPIATSARLPWIGLLVLGVVTLGWPLARALPTVSTPPAGAGFSWRRLWPVVVVPAVATPLVLRPAPTDLLPVVVGDYLAVHFLAYGLLTLATAAVVLRRGRSDPAPMRRTRWGALAVATLLVALYAHGALGLVIEITITNYTPVGARLPLLAGMLVGTLTWALADEWATRGVGRAPGGAFATKAAFVLSLAAAVALDLERLFFLIIIVPVIVAYFVVYGLFSRWSYRATGHPLPGAVASAVAFAWAITVVFPMLAG